MLCNDGDAANCQACDAWWRFCAIDFAYVLHLVSSGRIPSRLWLHVHINLNNILRKPKRTYTTCGENISRIYLQPLYCPLTYATKFPDSKPLSFSLMLDDIKKKKSLFFFSNPVSSEILWKTEDISWSVMTIFLVVTGLLLPHVSR